MTTEGFLQVLTMTKLNADTECSMATKYNVELADGIDGLFTSVADEADRLDYHHQLEHERIHLLLIDDAKRGLADIEAGRTYGADATIAQLQQRRAASTTGKAAKKRG